MSMAADKSRRIRAAESPRSTVLKVVSKRWGAELAMDDRVAGGHEGVGSGKGVSHPQ